MAAESAGSSPPSYPYPPPPYGYRPARAASFYVALILGLLLAGSVFVNLVLLVVAFGAIALGGAASGAGGGALAFREVTLRGDPSEASKVLVVPITGLIFDADTAGGLVPAEGPVESLRRRLAAAAKDDTVAGVIVEIDSPGGGVTASDLLHREIRRFREERSIPVVAVMKDVAASGGYYAAVATERIFAHPTTVTGSIGVILQLLNYGELFDKIGVKQINVIPPEAPFKDMGSPSRPMRPEERAKFDEIVHSMYERFVAVVKEGRPALTLDRVRELADGSVMTGAQALEAGLVDEIGYVEDAWEAVRRKAGRPAARLVEWRRPPTLMESLFGFAAPAPLPAGSLEAAVAAALRDRSWGGLAAGPRFLYLWPGPAESR